MSTCTDACILYLSEFPVDVVTLQLYRYCNANDVELLYTDCHSYKVLYWQALFRTISIISKTKANT